MGLFHEQLFTILLYFFSVLIAHNGFVYDFPLLFAEVDRQYPLLKNDLFKHICFGDSLVNLRTVRLRDFNFNAMICSFSISEVQVYTGNHDTLMTNKWFSKKTTNT